MHFGTDGADARADFAELVAWAAWLIEDGDVVCIAEGTIACDECEEGRFAAPVLAFEDPVFAAADCPVEVFEKRTAAETDVDVFEVDDDGRKRGRFFSACLLLGLDGGGGFFVMTAEGGGQFITCADADFNFDSVARKGTDNFFEVLAALGVEPCHGVIEDEFFWAFEEGTCEEDAAHFAVGK